MMGSYTKLYKSQLDFKNYDSSQLDKNEKLLGKVGYDEVKEIVAGLPTLNACIDKSYLQK